MYVNLLIKVNFESRRKNMNTGKEKQSLLDIHAQRGFLFLMPKQNWTVHFHYTIFMIYTPSKQFKITG